MRPLVLAAVLSVCAHAQTALEAEGARASEIAYLEALAADLEGERPSQAGRLIAQAWPALPDSLRRALGGAPSRAPVWAGAEIAGWWRGRDPLPITEANEAVAEHLRRVLEAEWRYGDASVRGFDERGAVFVMLGEPVEAERLESRVLEIADIVEPIPENELWTYGPGGPAYLFVKESRNRPWRQGSPYDLVPFWTRQTPDGFRALQEFLPEIMVAEPSYSGLMSLVDRALGPLEATPEYGLDEDVEDYFDRVVRDVRDKVEDETARAMATRDLEVEPTGPALPALDGLPLAVRVARFRAPNGGARLEVAWAPEPGAFVGLEGDHTVRSVATLSEAARPRGRAFPRVASSRALPTTATAPGATVPVLAATLDGLGRSQTVAVQVDVLEADGAVMRRAVRRVGPLGALEAGPGGLLVSDPLPHLVPAGAAAALSGATQAEADAARARWRYPYAVVVPGARLGVYVEGYDLGTEGGASRYEVVRSVWTEHDGERRFVSSSATESGTSFTTAREFIVVPVPAGLEAGDAVVLEGEIRDLVAGRAGAWSLRFGVVAP